MALYVDRIIDSNTGMEISWESNTGPYHVHLDEIRTFIKSLPHGIIKWQAFKDHLNEHPKARIRPKRIRAHFWQRYYRRNLK